MIPDSATSKHEQFRSFLMGGYECADHINRSGYRINLLKETEHDIRVEEDYAALLDTGIRTVREGICWSAVEKQSGKYDFSEVKKRIEAAKVYGIQQIWDLCHFGYPDDLVPTHPRFTQRFVALCKAFAHCYSEVNDEPLLVIPINEISFLAWHSGDVRGTVPFAINSGFDIKYHLCKAAIQGAYALKEVLPSCRIIWSEPLIKIHPLEGADVTDEINQLNEDQFQALDMIAGRMCLELGGSEKLLDLIGFNYYYDNQWEKGGIKLSWPAQKNRTVPFSQLLQNAYQRYNKPILITETGHFGEGRAQWITEIIDECENAVANGVDLRGICMYPLIDRPDWDDLSDYHNSGLWDFDNKAMKNRVVHQPYLNALQVLQELQVKLQETHVLLAKQ